MFHIFKGRFVLSVNVCPWESSSLNAPCCVKMFLLAFSSSLYILQIWYFFTCPFFSLVSLSVCRLNMIIVSLDRFFSPKPVFQYILSGELYRCKLTLPPNAALQTIVGPECRSSQLSRQLVCLDACKKLHQIGALNDHLLPFNEKPPRGGSDVQDRKLGAGKLEPAFHFWPLSSLLLSSSHYTVAAFNGTRGYLKCTRQGAFIYSSLPSC